MTSPRMAFDGFLLAALALLAFLLLGPALSIPLHVPINYNEGWNALFDTRAVTPGTGPLYPPPGSFVFDNYPPLGFYLVGAAGRFVFGDMILAGRVVALLALLVAAGLTGSCVRSLGGERRAALAAALLLPLNMATYFRQYVAMDDPQWLAHAIMLGGLALLLRRGGVGRIAAGTMPAATIIGAAALMVAGGFVKHNLIALPLAVTLWLAILDRRAAAIWLVAATAGLALGLAITAALHGEIALSDILHHRRVFRAGLSSHALAKLATLLTMAVPAAILLGRAWRSAPPARRAAILFVALFAPIATATGIVQRMGEGVYYNAHFETVIAICLAFGLALSPALATPIALGGRRFGATSLAIFAALPLIGAWPWHLPAAWDDISGGAAREAAWQPVIARIEAAQGPAGCILMSLCWWAGKPSDVDVFNLTESVLAGGPLAGFQEAVKHRHFAIFEEDPASFTHADALRKIGRDPIMDSFIGRYTPVANGPDGIVLLAPR